MVTQTIRVNLNQKDLETILAVQSDTLREIAFDFYATDAEEAVQLDPDKFTVKFNVLKPDNNFVMTTFTDGVIKLSDQITAVTGTGYYCILLMQDDELIYSGNGKIIINDHVIGAENIDSVSEADGYTFPDDFYTKGTPLAVLDDSTTSTTSTWSSNKINGEINTASTSAIAQLNAMKTGFDGVVYPSPAAMVTSCDQKILDTVMDTFDDVFTYEVSVNLYDYTSTERVENSYLNWRGHETSYTGAVISPYIAVSEGDILRWVYNPYTSNNYGSFYDGTKTFSGQIASNNPTLTNITIDGYGKKCVSVTVPSGVSFARVNLEMGNDNEYNMITVNNNMPNTFIPFYQKYVSVEMVPNPLYGKTAVFDGDSICAGTVGISSTDPKYGWGWAGRIGTNNRMTWHNFGVAGGTVCTDTYNYTNAGTTNIDWTQDTYIRIGSSASGTDTMYQAVTQDTWDGTHNVYYRGDARHWESTDIDTIYTAYPKADYIILEACLNDGFNGVPKGSVSASYSDSFVTTTWSSAFEYMLKRAIQKFPRAKIGVIFPPRPDGSNAYISELNGLAKQVCEKWGIPYIDLYKASGMCVNVSEQAAIMYYDSTHPSQAGYDFFTPKIEKWMQTL